MNNWEKEKSEACAPYSKVKEFRGGISTTACYDSEHEVVQKQIRKLKSEIRLLKRKQNGL